jgi:putative chitinase
VSAITLAQLAQACDCPVMRAQNWHAAVLDGMAAWGIDTPARQAGFLAQVAHESGRLYYVRELWGPTPAQRGYEGRKDLGNVAAGDGFRFMGRGLIQTTGRANYQAFTLAVRARAPEAPDFVANPAALEIPRWAVASACWYWSTRGLNKWADANTPEAFKEMTRRINGGYNGLDDRMAIWAKAKAALGVP